MKELRVMIAISCGKDNQDIGQSTRGRDNSPWKHFQCLKSFRITNVGFPLHLKKKKKIRLSLGKECTHVRLIHDLNLHIVKRGENIWSKDHWQNYITNSLASSY